MEPAHRKKLLRAFGSDLAAKQLTVLGIADNFEYGDRELVRVLSEKLERML